jgi:Na+-translocating ferredoxin:NAD+ oxidoreductase subunit B
LARDPKPFIAEMTEKTKPQQVVSIKEAECIGCTKCINVCPVDAIIGGPKLMHSVLNQVCTGCELCIPACPVDCIDIIIDDVQNDSEALKKQKAHLAKQRYNARKQRLASLKKECLLPTKVIAQRHHEVASQKDYIAKARARVKAKRLLELDAS